MFARAGKPATSSAQRFAKRAGNDVNPTYHSAELVRAAPGLTEKAGGVGIVNHGQRIVFLGQLTNRAEIGNGSIHRKTAIGRD